MSLARLVLRGCIGSLLAGHGLQKLKGSFGGPGLEGTEQMMSSIGMHPARHQALAAGLSETVGGSLTALGLFSPLGPAMITGVMAVAIKKVHAKNGVWVTKGGFEYNLAIIAASFLLAAEGPGNLSLDRIFGPPRRGTLWGLFALGLGLGSAAGALAIAERLAPNDEPNGDEPADDVAGDAA